MKKIFLLLLTVITFNANAQVPGTPYAGYEFTAGEDTAAYGDTDLSAENMPTFMAVEDRHGNLSNAAEITQVTRGYTTEGTNHFNTSFSFWMKHTANGLISTQRVLQMYGAGYGYKVEITVDGHLVVNGKAETSSGTNAVGALVEATDFADSQWHHFVITTEQGIVNDVFQAIKISLYVDNVKSTTEAYLIASSSTSSTLTRFFNSAALVISPTNDYTGIIDDLYFYNSILTDAEVTALFNNNTSITGINDNDNNLKMAIYPNPSVGTVNFKTTEKIEMITLSNISGQQVATYANVDKIDITHLSKGIYFASITTANNNIILKKIIKE